MSFTSNNTGGEYRHVWNKNDGWAHHETSATIPNGSAWMEWRWDNKPSGGHNLFTPNWEPNNINNIQPYIVVFFWRRTA